MQVNVACWRIRNSVRVGREGNIYHVRVGGIPIAWIACRHIRIIKSISIGHQLCTSTRCNVQVKIRAVGSFCIYAISRRRRIVSSSVILTVIRVYPGCSVFRIGLQSVVSGHELLYVSRCYVLGVSSSCFYLYYRVRAGVFYLHYLLVVGCCIKLSCCIVETCLNRLFSVCRSVSKFCIFYGKRCILTNACRNPQHGCISVYNIEAAFWSITGWNRILKVTGFNRWLVSKGFQGIPCIAIAVEAYICILAEFYLCLGSKDCPVKHYLS